MMHLKKLEMFGFKSFANKTDIVFEPGTTCIVGPNGSGKSNVIDAIKWVLGTLSYKSVRGDEMMDVVFKGASGVGPAGYAEVSLTLDNSDHTLPIEFSEVTVTRRLHRDGVGEYFINGSASRLKDIRDLLYGTGIGTDNYSIIEQGKIDRLVTSEPRARRLVFDEAAGISKYRAKRHEAELRLEKVVADQERMNLLISEVRTQLRSIRGQAGRAVRYKEMQTEYRARRTKLLGHEFRTLEAQAAEIAARIGALESEQEQRRAGLEAARASLAAEQEALAAIDARVATINNALSASSSRADYLADTLRQREARLAELAESREREERSRVDAALRAEEGGRRLEAIRSEHAQMEGALEGLRARIAETQANLADATRECQRTRGELDAKKGEAIELAHKESLYRNDHQQAKADLEGLKRRQDRVAEGARTAERNLTEAQGRLADLTFQISGLDGEVEGLKLRLAVEEDEQKRRSDEIRKVDEELVALRAGRDKCESRRETLRDLQLAYEGLGSGARELLISGFEGVRGTVVDLLETGYENVGVVEAALGELAGAVVVDSELQARAALDLVRARGLDRTTVLPIEACARWAAGAACPALPEGVSRVSALVRCEERFGPLVERLLGETLLVDDSRPEALRDMWVGGSTVVTRAGDVYDARGSMASGARAAGLLARKADLKKLETELGDFVLLIEEREGRRNALDLQVRDGDERLKTLRQHIYERGVSLSEHRSQQDQVERKCGFLVNERDTALTDLRHMAAQHETLLQRTQRIEGLLAELDGLKVSVTEAIASITTLIGRYEEGQAQIRAELTKLSMDRAQAEEKHRGLTDQLKHVADELERQREIARRNEETVREIEARVQSVRLEIETHRTQQEALAREIETRRAALEEAQAGRRDVHARSDAAGAAIREIEQASAVAAEQLNGFKIQQAQQGVVRENLVTRARDEFQLDLAALEPAGEEQDWEALARESEELRVKIANFGTVNTVALEQLKELEEREQYLVAQQQDLLKAKRELDDLIRRLNAECRIKFEKTFEFVREEFNTIFRKIFNGGKADIVLEQAEGVDPMDQGLEIMARPPQTELTSISLLSGGQKSLTAFALVMALFRANPSPFCILDEADAALDEKNVGIYADLINDFVKETQFLVISHNKRTMASADALYGVTMQTPGISVKVSVDLHGELGNLDKLRERREAVQKARAEVAAQKAAQIAELKRAAETAIAEEDAAGAEKSDGAAATAVAVEEPPAIPPGAPQESPTQN